MLIRYDTMTREEETREEITETVSDGTRIKIETTQMEIFF